MTRAWLGVLLVVICAVIEGGAQVAWKLSSRHDARRMVWIAAGVVLYGVEITLYTRALILIDVSIAFAMGSLSFVAVAVLSRLILKERISLLRAMGLGLILCGVALMGGQA